LSTSRAHLTTMERRRSPKGAETDSTMGNDVSTEHPFRDRHHDPSGADPYRRLTGEPPLDSADLAEARRWAGLYAEMVSFWEETLLQSTRWLERFASPRTRDELLTADQSLLEGKCAHVRRRLQLWQDRVRQLEQGESCIVHHVIGHSDAPRSATSTPVSRLTGRGAVRQPRAT
jgi:hypothetical protein